MLGGRTKKFVWSLFFTRIQTFCCHTKCLKQLKLASTPHKMFENIFFHLAALICPIYALKNQFPMLISYYHLLVLQCNATFSFYTSFFHHIYSRKYHFRDSKHFYSRRLRFQQMNVQSTVEDLISIYFSPYFLLKCKKQHAIICRLTIKEM